MKKYHILRAVAPRDNESMLALEKSLEPFIAGGWTIAHVVVIDRDYLLMFLDLDVEPKK